MTNHSVHVDKKTSHPSVSCFYWQLFDFAQETVTLKISKSCSRRIHGHSCITHRKREYPRFWLCVYSWVFLLRYCATPMSLLTKSFHVHSSQIGRDAFLIIIFFFWFLRFLLLKNTINSSQNRKTKNILSKASKTKGAACFLLSQYPHLVKMTNKIPLCIPCITLRY